jgi:hypothetical protein
MPILLRIGPIKPVVQIYTNIIDTNIPSRE